MGVPAINVYAEQFGSIRNAYHRIGYRHQWDFDWIDRRSEFKELLRYTVNDLIGRLQKAGSIAHFEPGATFDSQQSLRDLSTPRSLLAGPRQKFNLDSQRRISLPEGHIIAIRLSEGNKSVLDDILLPTGEITGIKIRFMETGLHRFNGRRFVNSAHLPKAVLHQIVRRTPTRTTVISSGRVVRLRRTNITNRQEPWYPGDERDRR